MRLIDADTLIKHLNDYALQESIFRDMKSTYTYRTIMECIKAVEEAPTAFNKREVKWELINARNAEAYKTDFANRSEVARAEGRYSAFLESISIVEKGGIEQ